MGVCEYALERLYSDQSPDLIIDSIPAVLAWLESRPATHRPVAFEAHITTQESSAARKDTLLLDWDIKALAKQDPDVEARIRRMRNGSSPHREHVAEVAAYGLAMVGISVWMPGRRAIAWSKWTAPDILFDDTPGALRGVEVAGRARGGLSALRAVLEGTTTRSGKRGTLRADDDIIEAHVSLWCAKPRLSILAQVKP